LKQCNTALKTIQNITGPMQYYIEKSYGVTDSTAVLDLKIR